MENDNSKTTIKPNGQTAIQGPVDLVDLVGNEIKHGPRFALCGYSKSNKNPFFEGSHNAQTPSIFRIAHII